MIRRFLTDESGAGAAEYGLILAIIGAGLGAAGLSLGGNVSDAVGTAAADIADVAPAPTASPS